MVTVTFALLIKFQWDQLRKVQPLLDAPSFCGCQILEMRSAR